MIELVITYVLYLGKQTSIPMSATETKTAIYQLVETIQDEQFLQAVYTILEKQATSEHDFWDCLADEQKESIKRGIADADADRIRPFQQVLQKYQ